MPKASVNAGLQPLVNRECKPIGDDDFESFGTAFTVGSGLTLSTEAQLVLEKGNFTGSGIPDNWDWSLWSRDLPFAPALGFRPRKEPCTGARLSPEACGGGRLRAMSRWGPVPALVSGCKQTGGVLRPDLGPGIRSRPRRARERRAVNMALFRREEGDDWQLVCLPDSRGREGW